MGAWIMAIMLLNNTGDLIMKIEARFDTEEQCSAALEEAIEEVAGDHFFIGGCRPDWRE